MNLCNGPTGSLCLQPLWQLHPAGIHTHTQLLIPDHLSTAAASLLTEVRPEAAVEVFTHVQQSIHSNLPPSLLSHSCSSLIPATGWGQEAEVCVTSSATPSSAASPGKLWAVNSCGNSDLSTFHPPPQPEPSHVVKVQVRIFQRKV